MGEKVESQLNQKTLRALVRLAREAAPESNPGEIYQRRFEFVLGELQKEKKITSWRPTEKDSPDDQRGIDYWIEDDHGTIPVSITGTKYSSNSKERARKNKKRENRGIINIFIRGREGELREDNDLRGEIIRKVKTYPELIGETK